MAVISKRLRYEILRRDNYACRYCGATAPDAKLVVDAVTPEALGGSHKDPANLVTACDPCNNGKSSSAPDAPLVADVTQDALRWSQAITAAAGEMLARASGDVGAHAHFEKMWKRFGTGPRRKPLPKDPGWQQTVDSLLSAGLPMAILEECVEIAMGQRKVAEENVFRYMCGVAWNKVSELQARAKEITQEPVAVDLEADPELAGRLSLARELLEGVTEDERVHMIESSDDRGWCEANGEPIPTEDEVLIQAASYGFGYYRDQLNYLQDAAFKALTQLPDGLGERAMQSARAILYDHWGSDIDKALFVVHSLRMLEDEIRYPAADQYLAGLPNEECAEWIAFATSLNSSQYTSDKGLVVLAARNAQDETLNVERIHKEMCSGTGRHIRACSERGQFWARIAELDCCTPDADEGHEGHLVCAYHLELLIDGRFAAPNGKTYSVREFAELEPVFF